MKAAEIKIEDEIILPIGELLKEIDAVKNMEILSINRMRLRTAELYIREASAVLSTVLLSEKDDNTEEVTHHDLVDLGKAVCNQISRY